ncbi:MAG: hypothetical protein H6Q63_522 [Firmicutes bacterium]|nr:hypothetical protein [Bacillota bacterium]
MEQSIREQLFALSDEAYQEFSSALLPGTENILGVRLPELRKLAKQIAKSDWREYLATAQNDYLEEIMLQGMVIGYVKTDIEEVLRYAADFVPKIDNWSVCDSFCSGLKFAKDNKERVWEFLQLYLSSKEEYEIRFGVVMLLNFYVDEKYISNALKLLDQIKHEGYYVKMAVAWTISIYYINLPEITMKYLKHNTLDDFTYNKALQKITKSLRVRNETKALIKGMKRK